MLKQREAMMAMQVAMARESFWWLFSATCGVAVLGTIGALKGKPFGLIPLYPLSFYNAYVYDMAYGFEHLGFRPKALRVRDMADEIILEEYAKGMDSRFRFPQNQLFITQEEYDAIIKRSSPQE